MNTPTKIEPLNLLFVCSRNRWRSPTAEHIWKNVAGVEVRSRGTSPKAERTVKIGDIRWADHVFVMETKHKARLISEFRDSVSHKPLHVLDIQDDYMFMDPELVEILEQTVPHYVPELT